MGIIANNSKIPESAQEMVDLYTAMVKTRQTIESGKGDINHEKIRYQRLEMKVDEQWLKLDHASQIQAVDALVAANLMKKGVRDVLVLFEGSIDHRPPPEPCLTITKEKP